MKLLVLDDNNIISNIIVVDSDWVPAINERFFVQGNPQIGYLYDSENQACYDNEDRYDYLANLITSWVLDENWNWKSPIDPDRSQTHDLDGNRMQIVEWNESTLSWDVIEVRDSLNDPWRLA